MQVSLALPFSPTAKPQPEQSTESIMIVDSPPITTVKRMPGGVTIFALAALASFPAMRRKMAQIIDVAANIEAMAIMIFMAVRAAMVLLG